MAVSALRRGLQTVSIEVLDTLTILTVISVVSQLTTIRAFQIRGYLLIAGFDLIQNPLLPGLSETVFWLLFAAYLIVMSAIIGYAVHRIRSTR